jgi:hypothetical protein
VFAAGLTFFLIASEYIVTVRNHESGQGRLIGWYATGVGAGAIAGPLLVGVIGVNELGCFLTGTVMFFFCAAGLSSCLSAQEGTTTRRTLSLRSIAIFMPVPMFAAFIFGVADNGGMSMLPVYGALNGWDNTDALSLAFCAAVGATISQLPIASLATKKNTAQLLASLSVCAIVLLVLLPVGISYKPASFVLAAGLGASIEGLFTIALIGLSRDRRVQSFAMLNACFISMASLGEVVGPAASSVTMDYFGPHGLIVTLVVAFAIYVLGIVNRCGLKSGSQVKFN